MFDRINLALNDRESEFIYNVLEIQDCSNNGQSPYRFWYNDFRENLDSRDITAELLLALDGFRMILKSGPSPKVQIDMHKVLNYIIDNNGWINDRQNW